MRRATTKTITLRFDMGTAAEVLSSVDIVTGVLRYGPKKARRAWRRNRPAGATVGALYQPGRSTPIYVITDAGGIRP